jgi:glycosyltransferase involved in cell wall biosynthesis
VAGGPRPTISDALSGSLAARAALRGTASFIGGATGRGVELGVGAATGSFHGDAGDILKEMGKAGLQSAVEESAAGPVGKPGRRTRQAQDGHDSTTGAASDSLSGEPVRVDAADPRLRGDVFLPTPLGELHLRREVRGAVVRLVGDTSERLFHGRVDRLTDPVTVTLTGQDGTPVQVEISLVRGMSESDGMTPAARYTPGDLVDGVRRFKVEVSAGADPRHVELALTRELTEIQSIAKKQTDHLDTQDEHDEQDTNQAVETFLLLSDEYSREKGGVVVFNRSLAEALADAGQNVVVRIGEDPAPYAHEQRANLRIIGPKGVPKGAKPRELISAKDDPANMPKKVDYVVGHTRFSGPDARATRNARYPDAKLIHFVHMVPDALGRVQEATKAGKALEGMRHHETERDLVAGSDLAVGVGPAITENAERMVEQARQLGQDLVTQKVLELIPGMEFRDRAPHSIVGRPMNVYISGRADAGEKGTMEAAKVVRMLRDVARVPARLIVRGVPEHLVVRQQIILSQIAGDVEVRPFTKERADLRADLDEADVMVMTSRAEGFGLTAHEAAASGVPTVVPSTSGFGRWLGEPGRFREELTGPSIVEQGYEDPVPIDRWFEALRNVAKHYPQAQQRALDLQQQFKDKKITWETAVGSLIDEARRLR